MAHPHHVLVHHHQQKTKKKRGKTSPQLRAFDNTVLALSFVYPLSGIPQAIAVWHGNGQASAVTWIFFFAFGLISLAYGTIHHIKPMIVTNIIWLFIDLAIIIGILR